MTVLRFDDNRGGLAYPFLPNDLQWQIVSRSFGDEAALAQIFQTEQTDPPTLRWVKDDKVLGFACARYRYRDLPDPLRLAALSAQGRVCAFQTAFACDAAVLVLALLR